LSLQLELLPEHMMSIVGNDHVLKDKVFLQLKKDVDDERSY
jgi:hypothetical protein